MPAAHSAGAACYADTAFFAKADVPHGKVEQATYKNYAGVEKANARLPAAGLFGQRRSIRSYI